MSRLLLMLTRDIYGIRGVFCAESFPCHPLADGYGCLSAAKPDVTCSTKRSAVTGACCSKLFKGQGEVLVSIKALGS